MKSAAAITAARGLLGSAGPVAYNIVAAHPLFTAAGELALRIRMTQDRLTHGKAPSFSTSFILADVLLDTKYPRRFANYSGDLSGRYIGALALLPPTGGTAQLDDVVRKALNCQRPDGRFGDANLAFTSKEVGREQMALLWGNGRLLVGLLEYFAVHPSAEVLAGARRLAEFLLRVQESCSRSDVMQRLVGQGASGFICFTQLIEGFALLGTQAGERRYLDAAARIIPWLQPRGSQHSHGYLTTLRGILRLHQATRDAEQLRYVENAYRDLVSSPDYTVYGGVSEYFGAGPGDVEEKARDEGCSEADFVRLSLQLWEVTGKREYLDRAERCLLNEFYFNQFKTGDFGHHTSYRYGYKPTESVARAWWCCTMHGLRAFRDVLDSAVTAKDDQIWFNLFLEGTWSSEVLSLGFDQTESSDSAAPVGFRVTALQSSSGEVPVAVRQPGWASRFTLRLNGQPVTTRNEEGYAILRRKWTRGDTLEILMDYGLRLQTRSGQIMQAADVDPRPVEAAAFRGPYLLAADSKNEPAFFGEPWMGNSLRDSNLVLLGRSAIPGEKPSGSASLLAKPAAHCRFEYIHGGWPDKQLVTLRPLSEQTASEPSTVAVWLRFRRA